jgi:diadenosine tetraphosphate (Ap4A) HIT family hydrolase
MSILNNEAVWIADLNLCTVLLKNDASYPWVLLIPRTSNYSDKVTEIFHLTPADQYLLITEIAKISKSSLKIK